MEHSVNFDPFVCFQGKQRSELIVDLQICFHLLITEVDRICEIKGQQWNKENLITSRNQTWKEKIKYEKENENTLNKIVEQITTISFFNPCLLRLTINWRWVGLRSKI